MNSSTLRTCAVVTPLAFVMISVLPSYRPTSASDDRTVTTEQDLPFATAREQGRQRSIYLKPQQPSTGEAPIADLKKFKTEVGPVLCRACLDCHGEDVQEGNVRIDTLDPDLLHGDDVTWWLEIQSVLTKSEMPPADTDGITDAERTTIVDWLAQEIQAASTVRREDHSGSSYRRMTRYEFNYALQDLLGRSFNFAKDLPPDPKSEDGFLNSAEMLHMSAGQIETYRRIAREALDRVTVRGEQPEPLFWSVSMHQAAAPSWQQQDEELKQLQEQNKGDEKQDEAITQKRDSFQRSHRTAHYFNTETERRARIEWRYAGAKYAWSESHEPVDFPPPGRSVAVIPPGQKLIVELGNHVPDRGGLRVRVRASHTAASVKQIPELELQYGWQASNDSHASVRVSSQNHIIAAEKNAPQIYEWTIPLSEIYPRNLVRTTGVMGGLPSPSEYIKFVNTSFSGEINIEHVIVEAPVYESWPPKSHAALFGSSDTSFESSLDVANIFKRFMRSAWRRPVTDKELKRKLKLYSAIRPECDDDGDAILEVLSTVLSAPDFLYVNRAPTTGHSTQLELASKLSFFLWCSLPDEELRTLARSNRLHGEQLDQQIERMLEDSRSTRFVRHFVSQWLGLQLLEYLNVDRRIYPRFRPALKSAMQQESVEVFQHMLRNDSSVIDFIHNDYTFVNEKLAHHYGIKNVVGSRMQRVSIRPEDHRGGLLTHAGLLAMNSDGKDSHPLKRGIWLLKNFLNDPPPPPPPAVPVIDLADPAIAKMTLKQRIENHRQQPACLSCHQKIDPWGIAFENYDAVGAWRESVGGLPVDASSELNSQQTLAGAAGLKQYLLAHRQDQFVRALTHKMLTFSLGRPLTFGDRQHVESIARQLRLNDDGLKTLIKSVIFSKVFQADHFNTAAKESARAKAHSSE